MPEFGTIPYLIIKSVIYFAVVAVVTFVAKHNSTNYIKKLMKPCILLQGLGYAFVGFAIAYFKSEQMEKLGAGILIFTLAIYAGAYATNITTKTCLNKDLDELTPQTKGDNDSLS